MPTPNIAEWLESEGAHHDIVTWASAYGHDFDRVWRQCPRADWLLAIAARLGVERQRLVRAAAACTRTALAELPEANRPVAQALELAEGWAGGERGRQECQHAASELGRSNAPDPVVAAVTEAARATLLAIEDPEAAAVAAANVAQAAVFGADDCAMMALLSHAQKQCAACVRDEVTLDLVRLRWAERFSSGASSP